MRQSARLWITILVLATALTAACFMLHDPPYRLLRRSFYWNLDDYAKEALIESVGRTAVADRDPSAFRDLAHLGCLTDGAESESVSDAIARAYDEFGAEWIDRALDETGLDERRQVCDFLRFERGDAVADAMERRLLPKER